MEHAAWTLQDRHKSFCADGTAKSSPHKLKSVTIDRDERIVKGIIAADVLDMEYEVIIPTGLKYGKGRYFGPGGTTQAVYLDHSWADKTASAYDRLPIGKCTKLTQKQDGLYAATYITKRSIGDEILILIEEEAIRGLTVGVLGEDEGEPTPEERKRYGKKCRNVIRSGTMLEYSLTSMPANPEAVLKCLRSGDIRRTTAALFVPDVEPSRKSFPVSGPAKCAKSIVLDANMDLMAIIG